jgi:L-threonylcarbamoyladenylate synthase
VRVIAIREHEPLDRQLAPAVDEIRGGGVVGFPTETFYGLAADPRSPAAVGRLFALKGRDGAKAIALLAADFAQVEAVAELPADGRRLAQAFWPGPLTLVLPARGGLAPGVCSDAGLVGIRISSHPVARALAAGCGHAVTATSANRSGEPPAAAAGEVATAMPDLSVIVDGGPAAGGAPSTLVEVSRGQVTLVRPGAIAWERVLESLNA